MFLIPAPTIFVLCKSLVWAWRDGPNASIDGTTDPSRPLKPDFHLRCLRRLAVPQALLAVMALLSYHVQIITRLSSAYPLWYMWLISNIEISGRKGTINPYSAEAKVIVRWMIIYAMVQGALFASFLPPA